MLSNEQIRFAQDRVAAVTGIALPWPVSITAQEDKGLTIVLREDGAAIAACEINDLARGFFLLSRAVKEHWQPQTIHQERHFSSCGAMLDMSRNAVMKVETVKRSIDQLAALGMNLLMLYTEDTFEVPEYPAFGYLRGGYTQAELREIDDYAASMGVELVPCIQTLAHLAQFLQWQDAYGMADLPDVLLIDDERTYDFIEAEICSISSCVRSRRIHIGMDEAHGVGLGQYYAKHGPTDRFELLNRHLGRVVKICDKYDLKPIMWSDMFFRLGSKNNDYYDPEVLVPQRVINSLPPVAMCYWDYYHTDEVLYDHMLTQHARMGQETVFAGGVWTWSGFLPQVKKTRETMRPALRSCARHHVDTVFATMWGDDGAETNMQLAFSLLPLFSEACWQGADAPQSEAVLAGECLTGVRADVLDAWGDLYASEQDNRPGKMLIWCDPLYPMLVFPEEDTMDTLLARCQRSLDTLLPHEKTSLECRYAAAIFRVCLLKGDLVAQLRERYLAGDREWLRETADVRIPALHAAYDALMRRHRALWERDNRRFGWEVLAQRYGAVMGRLTDVQDEIRRYLVGELAAIEELDAQPRGLLKARSYYLYGSVATPAKDIWQSL